MINTCHLKWGIGAPVRVLKRALKRTFRSPPRPMKKLNFFLVAGAEVECPICARNTRLFISRYPSWESPFDFFVLNWCELCGSGWLPDAKRVMDDYYRKTYTATVEPNRNQDPEIFFNDWKYFDYNLRCGKAVRASKQRDFLVSHGASFQTVFDFGCGPGYFLRICGAPYRFGYELDEASVRHLQFLGVENISPLDLPTAAVDTMLASQSLEHIFPEELDFYLSNLRRALKPEGRFYVEVPNAGLSWFLDSDNHDPHTIFFTAEGLERLLTRFNFKSIYRGYENGSTAFDPHPEPIYTPDSSNEFWSTRDHSSIIMIVTTQE